MTVSDGTRAETFGPYRLEGRLGRGGMGEVHRAYDTRRDRTVALERLTPELAEDVEIRERFERECRTAARLSSPHVVPIHDFGVIDGRLYLDMRHRGARPRPAAPRGGRPRPGSRGRHRLPARGRPRRRPRPRPRAPRRQAGQHHRHQLARAGLRAPGRLRHRAPRAAALGPPPAGTLPG